MLITLDLEEGGNWFVLGIETSYICIGMQITSSEKSIQPSIMEFQEFQVNLY